MREQSFGEEKPLIGDGSTSATPDTIDRQWEKKKRLCLVALIVGVFVIAARRHSINGSSYVKNLLKNGVTKCYDPWQRGSARIPTDGEGMDCNEASRRAHNHEDLWNVGGGGPQLGSCEGDCNDDSDCRSGLECFQRDGCEEVPGCSGRGVKGRDYCIVPIYRPLNNSGKDPSGGLGRCEGDCDGDWQCRDGLKCWDHRVTSGKVPDCVGVPGGWDFCYRAEYALHWVTKDPTFPLAVCEGDCDGDDACEGDLKCWDHRVETGDVPGCSGSGKPGCDYCYDPKRV